MQDAIERALGLSVPEARRHARVVDGHLDAMGDAEAPFQGFSQSLMRSRVLPVVYERWWRPALGQVAKGVFGPRMSDEHAIALELMSLREGDVVLDLACGPGNFTRGFASAVGSGGLVLGVDASETMLERAVAETTDPNVAYIRADAAALPLRDASVDAACCFAALNLFSEPFRALDELARVLVPGGRIAVFTSARPALLPAALLAAPLGRLAGLTVFGRDELTGALRERGFRAIDQRLSGVTQFVGATRS